MGKTETLHVPTEAEARILTEQAERLRRGIWENPLIWSPQRVVDDVVLNLPPEDLCRVPPFPEGQP